jgi:hypothetical protein
VNLFIIAARVAVSQHTSSALDVVKEAYASQPGILNTVLNHNGSRDITWIARQLKAGADPSELAKAVEDLFQSLDFAVIGEQRPHEYEDLKSLLSKLDEFESRKESSEAEMTEKLVGELSEWEAPLRKAWNWTPKTNYTGTDDKKIVKLVSDGSKPVGEIHRKRLNLINGLGLEVMDAKGADHRVFIFKPENRDVAEMVCEFFWTNAKSRFPGEVCDFMTGIGLGYDIDSTIKWIGKTEVPWWVKKLI